ncbi:hypothetical protein DERP_002044 [Dermatophagoides pteronyssinus]|uniref:Uncharacterized protein n=1 Tax=Dermatophagoides pteronyssinus TaxID=6956 RepID=A0ABQ8JGL6_DERPT|nr:hypothetical protein DERP_002044 [Dermatophagoides pteronyssinus]
MLIIKILLELKLITQCLCPVTYQIYVDIQILMDSKSFNWIIMKHPWFEKMANFISLFTKYITDNKPLNGWINEKTFFAGFCLLFCRLNDKPFIS